MGGPVSYVKVYKQNTETAANNKYQDLLEKLRLKKNGITVLTDEPNKLNAEFFAPQRKNLFSWYPFKEKSSILVIGDEGGAATGLLAANAKNITALTEYDASAEIYAHRFSDSRNLKIYSGNISELIIGFESAFDYIIIMPGYATPQMLKEVSVLKNENTTILIVAENRMGMKYLNGAKESKNNTFLEGPLGYIGAKQKYYSKPEWENILKENGANNYKFHYLYPDYYYVDEVYTDNLLPKEDSLKAFEPVFEENRISVLEQSKLINKILKNNEFTLYANSYFIEIPPSESNNIDYAKISCERSEKYQACTLIINTEEGKIVKKVPAVKAANEHILRIEKSFNKLQKQCVGMPIEICECEPQEDSVNFKYISGQTLGSKINNAIKNGNQEELLRLIESLRKTVNCLSSGRTFTKSFKFINYFGNISMPSDLNSAAVSNIDLIADNIISDDKNIIIDYEWVLDFPVPLEFIIFRSIYHNYAISSLSKELKNKVYEAAGLNSEHFAVFKLMEEIFQKKISGRVVKYSQIAKAAAPLVCNINDIDINKTVFKAKIYNAENPFQIYTACNAVTQDIHLTADFGHNPPKKVAFTPTSKGSIVKIKEITALKQGNSVTITDFETNANLVIGDDYYFVNEPVITVTTDDFSEISIKYFVYRFYDSDLESRINLILENNQLREKIKTLEETGE